MEAGMVEEDVGQAEGAMYTRGRPGDEDKRGSSMVQKHFEKLQQEKEDAAMSKLQSLMPQLGSIVRDLALKEVDWNVDKAALLLRRFQVSNASKLTLLQKKRKRILSELAHRGKQSDDDQKASTSSPSSSEVSSQSDRPKRKRSRTSPKDHKKKKKKISHKSSSKRKEASKAGSRKGNELREVSKDKQQQSEQGRHDKKRDKKEKDGMNLMYQYGKYGVIRETDWQAKRTEFVQWASEVKGIDVEHMPRSDEKEFFKDYIEDYNTGTLPHRKFYDVEMYERRKFEKSSKKTKPKEKRGKERLTFNDEEEKRHELARERAKQQEDRVKEAYEEMMHGAKAEDMREQELLRMQMALAYKTGDTKTVEKLADRLRPDDGKESKKTADK